MSALNPVLLHFAFCDCAAPTKSTAIPAVADKRGIGEVLDAPLSIASTIEDKSNGPMTR